MIIGVPKEIKPDEYRVAMTPAGVEQAVRKGHVVLIERAAGLGSGLSDAAYAEAGAQLVASAAEVYQRAQMIVKVKEPLPAEYPLLRPGQIVFAYFHFASSRELTEAMIRAKIVAIAYETVRTDDGRHPLLTPMSEVAGKMSIQEGAKYLENPMMGRGILLGGVPGVAPADVLIIGGGVVGTHAAKVAAGLGANVVVMDINADRLRYLDDIMPRNVTTLMSSPYAIREHIARADLVVCAVLVEGARAPVLITRDMLATMRPGSVIVDVSVDQGGCAETTRPTTHHDPTYVVDGVVHYAVTNMPGAVGMTSTYALTNVTLPYAIAIADKGYVQAARDDPAICRGLDIIEGRVTNRAVAETFAFEYHDPRSLL